LAWGVFLWPGFAKGNLGLSYDWINGFLEGVGKECRCQRNNIVVALALNSIPLGGMFLGRDANVTKAVQDKTFCDAGREGLDR
jgi:hypothetical protein